MKKILFAAKDDSIISDYYLTYLKYFKDYNYEIHVLTNSEVRIPYCDKKINVDFSEMKWPWKQFKLIKKVKKLIKTEKYDTICTTSTEANTIVRKASRNWFKKKGHIVSIIDGFPFYIMSNKFDYNYHFKLEKKLSRYVNKLVILNSEDYILARKNFKNPKDVCYMPGLGIDINEYRPNLTEEDLAGMRERLNITKNDYVILCEGDLTDENHQFWLIKAISDLFVNNPNFHLLLLGADKLDGKCQEYVLERNLERQIHFLGYRTDEAEIMQVADVALNVSINTGFSVSVLKAICAGLPIIATDIRGNRDFVDVNDNGFLIDIEDANELCSRITQLYNDPKLVKAMREYNKTKAEEYSKEVIEPKILDLLEK